MNRRAFFVALFAPFLVRLRGLLPKPKPRYTDWACIAVELERIRPMLPDLFEESDRICGLIKNGAVQTTSRYLYRVPFQREPAAPATFDFIKV